MPNPNLIKVLESELENAKTEKKNLEARIFRLETFLRQEREASTGPVVFSASGDTFQDKIRDAIRQSPKGIRPQMIVDHFKEIGFEVSGSSPVSVKVANELARLARLGEIEKVERGIYRSVN